MVATAIDNGAIICSQNAAKSSLANCAEVLSFLSAGSEAAALARIYINETPAPSGEEFTLAELNTLRPYMLVGDSRQGVAIDVVAIDMMAESGQIDIWLERDLDSDSSETRQQAELAMQQTMGRIAQELIINGTVAGYIIPNAITIEGPFLPSRDDVATLGDFISGSMSIQWSNGGEGEI